MESQEKLVVLNADQKAVALKGLKDLFFAAQQMHEWLSKDNLTEEMKGILISLSESHISDVAKATNYESNLAKERADRHADIRNANMRIHELEQQMAEMKPIDGLKEQLAGLTRKVDEWWDELGFNYISEMSFSKWGGLDIKFGFQLDRLSRLLSSTPVSDKEEDEDKIQQLRNKGFIFTEEDREVHLADNDINKQLLVQLLEERFPSIQITGMETWSGRRSREAHIRYVTAYLGELHEI
ncbi:hypothetical protein WR52_20120 [Bacillus cereus]|uniref:hypothetical protein n=1 Tax=Bacillus cereus TaxID=1396 RepID=UPI0007B6C28C|nr:hypothetical protein [Bacillus cereus]ANC20973.1 hypothetical protein WR52_20120 [Bacillus cereus]